MDNMNNETNIVLSDLKNFLQFLCEGKSCSIESVINSSISLLNDCPSSRDAVLQFYSQLLDDYCREYCIANINCFAANDANIAQPLTGERVGPIISRFISVNKSSTIAASNELNVRKLSTESGRHSLCSDDGKMAATPQSPVAISSPMDSSADKSNEDNESDTNWSAIISSLDFHFTRVSDALMAIINNESNTFSKVVTDWSLELAAKLSAKYSRFSTSYSSLSSVSQQTSQSLTTQSKGSNSSLSSSLAFWLQCPAMQTLTNLTIATNNIEIEALFKQLLQHSPHSDWILAHLITTMSSNSGFNTYIERLMQSAASSNSVTCILAYLSEHNPRAIVNSSKTNIPFLLELCTNSKPLLDLLSQEAAKNINYKVLNDLAAKIKAEELNDCILYCMTNSPNAFELLLMAFDISIHLESSELLKSQTLHILSLIISHIHAFVYGTNVSLTNAPPILILLKNNSNNLILNFVKTISSSSRRLQLRLLHLLCIHYGIEFVTEVLHHILNAKLHQIDCTSFRISTVNPLLCPLLKSLKLQYGSQIHQCLSDTLKLPLEKSVSFWAHLLVTVENESIYLDIDLLTKFFFNINQDSKANVVKRYYILRLMLHTMEKFPKRIIKPQHRLCLSLVSTYFELIKSQQFCSSSELDIYMDSIVTCQKSMSHLSKSYSINEHILTRILLELSLEKNELFNRKISKKEIMKDNSLIRLLKENVLYDSGNSKFRKIPLIPGKKEISLNDNILNDTIIINQQLVLDAFRSCVVDMVSFSKLLVQCVSPDLIFNDTPWPDEDPRDGQLQHLRVTIERDLCISRLFELNPILWDLCELISNSGFLSHCLALIRALMTVQRTHWASTSLSKENIIDTQRLLTLLSKSGVLPSNPFKYVPQVLSRLQPWEVSYILNDICKYLKDSTSSTSAPPIKPYVERLRILMAHNMPGDLFVSIFKDLYNKN